MRDYLSIFLNGRPLRVEGADAFTTLTDFLRKQQRLTGTKVVCAEGDCGACAVLVGRVEDAALRYSSVCACIQLMFQLDGAHVVTVEGLRDGTELNCIQQAMVKCHGAQCGFCTPGFIVSLYDLMRDGETIDAAAVRRGLTGNLCRCTGYDSIIRAALETDHSKLEDIDQLYSPGPIHKSLTADEVLIQSDSSIFYKPVTVDQAVRFRANHPGCAIVCGATDLGVQSNKGVRRLDVVMSTAGLSELRRIAADAGVLTVGAGVTLTELQDACRTRLPELAEFLEWFGSPLIRNAATLIGNLVNASPIGDMIPALFVLDAEIEIAGPDGRRWVNIQRFYTGYRQTVLAPGDIVTAARIPLLSSSESLRLYKVSKRKDLDISSFGAAIWMRRDNGTINDIRIAYGGVGPTVLRLPRTEALLRGSAPTHDLFERAAAIAKQEISPISDVRGSSDYRRVLAGNILLKFWHEMEAVQQLCP
jgi:xanthine dehydrogenase small subunit